MTRELGKSIGANNTHEFVLVKAGYGQYAVTSTITIPITVLPAERQAIIQDAKYRLIEEAAAKKSAAVLANLAKKAANVTNVKKIHLMFEKERKIYQTAIDNAPRRALQDFFAGFSQDSDTANNHQPSNYQPDNQQPYGYQANQATANIYQPSNYQAIANNYQAIANNYQANNYQANNYQAVANQSEEKFFEVFVRNLREICALTPEAAILRRRYYYDENDTKVYDEWSQFYNRVASICPDMLFECCGFEFRIPSIEHFAVFVTEFFGALHDTGIDIITVFEMIDIVPATNPAILPSSDAIVPYATAPSATYVAKYTIPAPEEIERD